MASRPDLLLALESIVPSNNSIEKIYGMMLYGAVRHARPSVVVELGTAVGYSAAWMLLGLHENEHGHLYCVDIAPADNPVWKQVGIPIDRLTYFSNDYVHEVRAKIPDVIDLAFHDAGHSLDEVKRDLSWVIPRISVGGSLIVHDVVYNPAIGEALRALFDSEAQSEFWKYEQIDEASGVGIATRLKAQEVVCTDVSSGSTTPKATGSLPEKTAEIISVTTPRSRRRKAGARRSKKTRLLYSSRGKNRKALVPVPSSSNGSANVSH